MNIDITLADQGVSSTLGMTTSTVTASAEPPLDEFARLHRFALVLLQLPAIPPRVLQWLTAMPIRALQWIWDEADPRRESEPLDPVEAFAKACTVLSVMPIESAELTCADIVSRLDRLLVMLRHSWRFVPPGLLAKMLLVLPPSGSVDRLRQLQLQHVADWSRTRNRRMLSAPRRDWAVFVEVAMKWRHHDEPALRTHPRTWKHPLANLQVNGFVLTPVCGTAYLVDAQGHQGAALRQQGRGRLRARRRGMVACKVRPWRAFSRQLHAGGRRSVALGRGGWKLVHFSRHARRCRRRDRKSTRLNSSHERLSRMPSSA